jgi:alpha-beta hydrolase superfamily lysophospholipase
MFILRFFVFLLCLLLACSCLIDLPSTRRWKFPPGSHPIPFTEKLTPLTNAIQEHGIFAGHTFEITSEKGVKPEVIIVGFHGLNGHSGFGMALNAHQICKSVPCAFVNFDQKGFGTADGLFGLIEDWSEHVDSCANFVENFVKPKFPDLPIIGLGYSMGGGVAVNIAIEKPKLFNDLILLAPMVGFQEKQKPNSFTLMLIDFMARFFPKVPIISLPSEANTLYRDAVLGEKTTKFDHLRYAKNPRFGTVSSLIAGSDWIQTNKHRLETPFYIIQGAEDKVTLPESAQELFEAASSKSKKIDILDGYHHCIVGAGQEEHHCLKIYDLIVERILAGNH